MADTCTLLGRVGWTGTLPTWTNHRQSKRIPSAHFATKHFSHTVPHPSHAPGTHAAARARRPHAHLGCPHLHTHYHLPLLAHRFWAGPDSTPPHCRAGLRSHYNATRLWLHRYARAGGQRGQTDCARVPAYPHHTPPFATGVTGCPYAAGKCLDGFARVAPEPHLADYG